MALGKPAIATPNQLDLRPVATAVSNIRQRIEAIEASLNTTTAIAGTTVNLTGSQISALQQALAALTIQVNALSGGSFTAVDDASLTIAQQALQRHAPAPPPSVAESLSILAVQVFGA